MFTVLPVSRYDLCKVLFVLLQCCHCSQGLCLSLKSSKVNQHLGVKCCSAGPVPQRPEGPDSVRTKQTLWDLFNYGNQLCSSTFSKKKSNVLKSLLS